MEKVCHLLCCTVWLSVSNVDARWKVCCVLCCTVLYIRLVCTWEVDAVPFTLQYHLCIKGGRCVPYSAVPNIFRNSWVWELCKCACKAEGLTRTLQYRLFDISLQGSWTMCQQLCNTLLWIEGEGVSPILSSYSAIPHLHRSWKECPLLCSTVSGWKVEKISRTLRYNLCLEGGRFVFPTLQRLLWMEGGRGVPVLCNTVSGWKVKGV